MRLDTDFYDGQRVSHVLGFDIPNEATEFPLPVTEELLDVRGQEPLQYHACAACHDRVGTGNGKVVQRGYLKPPSYHSERLRGMKVGHIYQVITRGQGGMPAFYDQITPRDRWAIVSYVRALQLSQNFPSSELTPDEKAKWEKEAPAAAETPKKESH